MAKNGLYSVGEFLLVIDIVLVTYVAVGLTRYASRNDMVWIEKKLCKWGLNV